MSWDAALTLTSLPSSYCLRFRLAAIIFATCWQSATPPEMVIEILGAILYILGAVMLATTFPMVACDSVASTTPPLQTIPRVVVPDI